MDDVTVFYNQPVGKYSHITKWIPSILILPAAVYYVLNRGEFSFMDNADLVIHEGGHFFFIVFGKFIYTAGGTIMQIALPSLIIWYFYRNSYRTGMQFVMLWLGQNLVNISVYSADAQARRLPLLGGNRVYHDWAYMLNTLGILEYDQIVGYIFFSFAILIFILSIFLPFIIRD